MQVGSEIERAQSTLSKISTRTALYRSLMKPGGRWTTAAMCDGRRHGIIGNGGRITEFGWLCAELAQRQRDSTTPKDPHPCK